LLEAQVNARGAALIVDADADMPPVPVDAPLLHQAVMNLLTNALEAVEPGKGVITVRLIYYPPGGRGEGSPPSAELAVIDNGPGIPKERQARIFEPFHTTKGSRGTGLGLAVTKRIVEEHRGRIRVESAEGQGAIFRIILPAETTKIIDPSETAHSKPSPADLGGPL
jgi:two-component system, NtrC family, sensor kinase